MPVSYQLLQALRLTAIMQALQDTRELPGDLRFLARTPVVPATDGEIMARFSGYIQIADLVADDAQAVTYSTGKFTFESNAVPNLKLGVNLTQEQINQLLSLEAGLTATSDNSVVTDWRNRTIDGLLFGIRQRMEALIIAMQLDGFSYNRLGIIMTNVSWGMPSDLKVTAGVSWDTAGSATPVADLLALKLIAQVRYGQVFNRVTMSTTAFRYMIATTEFQNKARMYLAPNVSYANLPLADLNAQQRIAEATLGMTIELYDSRYWSQAPTGAWTSAPYLPAGKIILSNSGDDNSPMVMDFANGVVTESVVAELAGGMFGSLGGAQRGPIAYATVPNDLNPPAVTLWGVARGFPRRHKLQATAVLTVGSFTDSISVGAPTF